MIMGTYTTYDQGSMTFGHREDALSLNVKWVRENKPRGYVWKYKVSKQNNQTPIQTSLKECEKIYTRLKYANKNLGYYILPSLKEFRPEIRYKQLGQKSASQSKVSILSHKRINPNWT